MKGITMKNGDNPVTVEFIKYDLFNSDKVKEFVGESLIIGTGFEYQNWETLGLKTSEGITHVRGGDYIVKSINGEFYQCSPYVFNMTYGSIKGGKQMKYETILKSIEAVEFRRDNLHEIEEFLKGEGLTVSIPRKIDGVASLIIATKMGTLTANEGDYIVKYADEKLGVYCANDFNNKYRKVE